MTRKEMVLFLGELMRREWLGGIGKYWASDVIVDHGTAKEKWVDFMQIEVENQVNISSIEKGIIACYEVRGCEADFKRDFGRNFVGEKNYFVMPMSLYKEIAKDIPQYIGVLTPVPRQRDKVDEFKDPTELKRGREWKMSVIKPAVNVARKKSMTELLFCMLGGRS